jgi:hypothetical protein
MRSGSTLLQHILDQHSTVRSYSDLSAYGLLARILAGVKIKYNFCMKPMDLFYLTNKLSLYPYFNKFLWIARDPRDSYLSSIESGYAYLFWSRGRKVNGIDIGLLQRWKRVYSHYFNDQSIWHLVKYEELVTQPDAVLERVLGYLGLDLEHLLPFKKFNLVSGGDHKIRGTSTVNSHSVNRHKKELSINQIEVFNRYLAAELRALGYE